MDWEQCTDIGMVLEGDQRTKAEKVAILVSKCISCIPIRINAIPVSLRWNPTLMTK